MTIIRLNDSGVVFNKENHTYHLEGTELSGITSVIQRQLFPNEYDDVPEEMIQAAALYGKSGGRRLHPADPFQSTCARG